MELNQKTVKQLIKGSFRSLSTDQIDEVIEHRKDLRELIGDGNVENSLLLKMRWYSTFGVYAKDVLLNEIKRVISQSEEQYRTNPEIKPILDFESISYRYKDQDEKINDVWKKLFGGWIGGGSDLRGLSLENIKFVRINIKNAKFSECHFKDIEIRGCDLDNVFLGHSKFESSKIESNEYQNNSVFQNSVFKKCLISRVPFECIFNIEFDTMSTIKMWRLASSCFRSNRSTRYTDSWDPDFTRFYSVSKPNYEKVDVNNWKKWNGINECMEFLSETDFYSREGFRGRQAFLIKVLTTRNWTSFVNLGITILLIDLLYSLVFYFFTNQFEDMASTSLILRFINAFYFSTVTLTTLGFGDIKPLSAFMKIVTISEVIVGYLFLGLFVNQLSASIGSRKK